MTRAATRKRERRQRRNQLGFQFKRRNKHGGKRKGAGRKRTLPGPKRVAHRTRPKLASRFPVHVTSRLRKDVGQMQNRPRCKLIRETMFRVSDEAGFRICEFSIERHHLHLICEAKSSAALARGIKRFKQLVALAINRLLKRGGSVFVDRYHTVILKSPRQTKNTILYVLQNARRHGAFVPAYLGGVDPYSSGWWFDGWQDDDFRQGRSPPKGPAGISEACTWLLSEGWRRHGLIGIDEIPAAGRSR